ncbi:MAG: hypothetical protein KJO54_10420 [Gammaproteobacteria bacterium]|nr:hypothetical protein [Gammaproteobacteria bacterium]
MDKIQSRFVFGGVMLLLLGMLGACPSTPGPREAFWFKYHLETLNSSNQFSYARQCTTDGNGNITSVTQRGTATAGAVAVALAANDQILAACATRWTARFNSTTNSVTDVRITSGERSRTSSQLTTSLRLGGMANSGADRFIISGVGRLTGLSIVATGAVRNASGTPLWVPCTAEMSFQADDSSNPRPVFSSDFCQVKYTIFDDSTDDAAGQFRVVARNIEDANDRRLLVLPDGAFTLNLH